MYSAIPVLVQALAQGEMIILQDDPDRENEGDLIIAAQHVKPHHINFMITEAKGLVCLAMNNEKAKQLKLTPQNRRGRNAFGTAFLTSIEAAEGISTGISASDRAKTIQAAASLHANPDDLVTPGHVFPVLAKAGGVLARPGHTEAVCDLLELAKQSPIGVMCEILNAEGDSANTQALHQFAQKHGLKMGTVAELVAYRQKQREDNM